MCTFCIDDCLFVCLGSRSPNRTLLGSQSVDSVRLNPSSVAIAGVGFLSSDNKKSVLAVVVDSQGNVSVSESVGCNRQFLLLPTNGFSLSCKVLGIVESTKSSLTVLCSRAFVEIGWVEGVQGKELGVVSVVNYKPQQEAPLAVVNN